MNKSLALTAVLGAVIGITGCGTTGKFIYPANMSTLYKSGADVAVQKKVAVVPFDDYRADENSNFFPAYLVPLFPYGWADYERPDAAAMFASIAKYDVTPAEDLAKATATSLRRSGLFTDAFFTMGGEKDRADFVVSGRIKVMRHSGKMLTYGLSVFGPLLWYVGAPAAKCDNVIALELEMRNKEGKIVWECTIDRQDALWIWLYHRMGWDCKAFASMYQDAMNAALVNLSARINSNPDLFK